MLRTVEAVIDEEGNVRLLEPIRLPSMRRAFVTILEDEPVIGVPETALLSEPALAEDWSRPEEDVAWSHLQEEINESSNRSSGSASRRKRYQRLGVQD